MNHSNHSILTERKNIVYQIAYDFLGCYLALFVGGTLWQGLLLHCGLSNADIGLLGALGSVAQIAAMALDIPLADRFKNPLRVLALSGIPMLFFFSAIFLLCVIGEHAFSLPLLACCVLTYYAAYGFRSIFSYKIPYLILQMEHYGRVIAVSGLVSNLLCISISFGISYLLNAFDYMRAIAWLYGSCVVCVALTVVFTLRMKPLSAPKTAEVIPFSEIIRDKSIVSLIPANFLRGISMGIVGSMTLIAAGIYHNDASALSLLVSLTTLGALLGNFLFSLLGKPAYLSRLCLTASAALTVLGVLSVLGGWWMFSVLFVFIQIAFIVINDSIPVMLAQSTSYRVIGGCTSVRMMITMAGSALSGWLTGLAMDHFGGVPTAVVCMLCAGLTQIYCGLSYARYQKEQAHKA